ncbi:MAG: P-loop containing nucleoside triphosphate hydrolase protein [Monoraphidium minutum]|nr:MAG: P-loop containing nucleoside triphosphate hydrolase protein [Monoraphidium minutum]
MPTYNFKSIQVVPPSKDFIDIVLSKTQRQTPTVCHNGWQITRIRSFYMRKVKHCQSTWHDKLSQILDDFPKVEDIHPFYGDLLNVLYDRDHYKLALGQLNTARNLIDKLTQDYVRLIKYGDSLYRCKELKRAALGRMCTLMRRQDASLKYLEQVRQHMSRLPSIDPAGRSLLLCGYPNVGKSSLMNRFTRADVEVQPYAFTTKALYVGHLDYKYLRWQVLDTPGILDRPLEERNTIEMQSVTALAHLRASVLYLVDVSEACGYTLAQQAALFHSIKPLFANKPVIIVANKVDSRPLDALSPEETALLEGMASEAAKASGAEPAACLMAMSALSETGIAEVKTAACERLLAHRVEAKVAGKRIGDVLNRMHVALPKPRAGGAKPRPPVIPAGVAEARARRDAGEKRRTEKDAQEEAGGAGVYSADLRKMYDLKDPSWRYDIMPEILDGHNIADFVDADIDAKLAELEREEEELAAAHDAEMAELAMGVEELGEDEAADLDAIRKRKKEIVTAHRIKKAVAGNRAVVPAKAAGKVTRTAGRMRESLGALGIDTSAAEARMRAESRGRKRTRSASAPARGGDAEMAEGDGGEGSAKKRVHSSKSRSMSRGRALSLAPPSPASGLKDAGQRNKAVKMADRAQRRMNKMAKVGEADRVIQTKMPKHLFSGKRGKGKTDWR